MSGNFQLSFFNKRAERVLLLPAWDAYQGAVTALGYNNLKEVSFINVFENGKFAWRYYVRSGKLMPHRGMEYDLTKDRYLKSKLISNKPVLGVERLRQMAKDRPGHFRDLFNY